MADQPPLTIKQQRDLKQEEKERRRAMAARGARTKNIITWSIVGLAVAGIVALVVMSSKSTGSTSSTLAAVTADDHIQGPTTAKAVLVEYSDFQCPACGAYYPIVKDVQNKYGDKLEFVYRNYPLTQLHEHAQEAAQAAEAANLQGKFWEMHDLLFERQTTWSTDSDVQKTFTSYAKELKLDEKKFTNDMNSSTVKDRVQRDVDSGNAVAINATPTFFLNGKKLTNPSSADAFGALIDPLLTTTNTNQ